MRIKRYLSFILVFALVLSGATTAFASGERTMFIEPEEMQLDTSGPVKFEGEMTAPLYNDNDDVRIIVELNDEPAISYAQSQGVEYAALSETTKTKLQNDLLSQQAAVRNDLASRGINMDYANSFTVAFNGFSGIVKGYEIEAIKNNSSVKEVYISNEYLRPEPEMQSSHDMIGSYSAWGVGGYKGEGMIVAIIDTGIDPSHKDFQEIDEEGMALTQEGVNDIKTDKNLLGKFYTKKVPYGYNYFDLNAEIKDLAGGSQHGQHVAGTVAANGELKGVAPQAQLLAMKVFSNNPAYKSTYDDIYMKAIEESIALGVDVINMSLGGTAAFYVPNSAMDKMITEARKDGVVFAISAGNSAHSTDGTQRHNANDWPTKENPDIGLVGSPSLNKDSISVASVENLTQNVEYLTYTKDGNTKNVPIQTSTEILPSEVIKAEVDYVDCGLGKPEDFTGKNLTGKVALIERGEIAFGEKIENAQKAGAIAVIIFNNTTDGDKLMGMALDGYNITVPATFAGRTDGLVLKGLSSKKVKFPEGKLLVNNPNAGRMSSFTSWGTTPSLELKPEISAPGGQIYSTQNNDGYTTMSGTSMAAPHLAGGTALVLQYIEKNFKNLSIDKQSEFAKTLLMNTANPVKDEYNGYYSPRRQGAGMMQLDKAVTTPTTVVNKSNGEAKVELKDFTNKVFNMTLTATNHSDKEVEYKVGVDVMANGTLQGLNILYSWPMPGAVVSGDESVNIPAGGSKDITVTVDLTNAKVPNGGGPLYENMFVEGFIHLIAPIVTNEENIQVEKYPSLVVPYVGFYGDWAGETSPRILDGMKYFGESTYYGYAGIVNQNVSYMGWVPGLGYNGAINRIAIAPGTDSENQGVNSILSFMRNAEALEVNILDAKGKLIRKVSRQDWLSKTFYNQKGIYYSYIMERLWDGTVNNKIVEDGKYTYQIKALPHYEGAKWQVINIPVTVDTVKPVIKYLKQENKKLTWTATDENSGIAYCVVSLNGKELEDGLVSAKNGSAFEYDYSHLEFKKVDNFSIVAYDMAGNTIVAEIKDLSNDKTPPTVELTTPKHFSTFNRSSVTFTGKATDNLGVEEAKLTITREDFSKEEVLLELDGNGRFSETLELEDGLYMVNISAKDIHGNENLGYTITIFVGTTAPVVEHIDTQVIRTNYVLDLFEDSNMLSGGGRTVIFVEDNQAYAYNTSDLMKNEELRARFDEATEKYIKLANGVFVDQDGSLVTSIPEVKYFDNSYYANVTINVEENFSYFKIYANDNDVYEYNNFSRTKRNPFNGEITFRVELLPTDTEINLVVIDEFGNITEETIALEGIIPKDETVSEDAEIAEIEEENDGTVTATLSGGTEIKGLNKEVKVEAQTVEVVETVDIIPAGEIFKFTVTGLSEEAKERGLLLKIPATKENAGLSYYNEETKKWELVEGSNVVTEGEKLFVQATVYHFSTYGALEITPQLVANAITKIQAPAKDEKQLVLPKVPAGFDIRISYSSSEVISLEGAITPPEKETTVYLELEVSKAGKIGLTNLIKVVVPAGTTIDPIDPDDEVIDRLADKLVEVYGYLTVEEIDDIRTARTELQSFVKNASDAEWDAIIEELLTEEVIAKFDTEEKAKNAVKEFVALVSEIYYTTEKSELVDLIKEFNINYKDTFALLFGEDITLVDLFDFILAAKNELSTVIQSDDADILAFGTKEEVIDLIPELISKVANIIIRDPKYSNFDGKLSALGWNVRMLVAPTRALVDIIDPSYKAEIAIALAVVRSESNFELEEPVKVGDVLKLTLTVMGRNITTLVDFHIEDEEIISSELEALKAGITTITAHRAGNVLHFIGKVVVEVLEN